MPGVRQLWGVPSLRKPMPPGLSGKAMVLMPAVIKQGSWERPRWECGEVAEQIRVAAWKRRLCG